MPQPSHKTCTVCGEEKPLEDFHRRRHRTKDGRRTACKECTNARNREENRDRSDIEKQIVRRKTRDAVENGELVKGPCEVCGTDEDIEAHHLHYDQPDSHLVVQWLCVEHHRAVHGTHVWTKQLDLF